MADNSVFITGAAEGAFADAFDGLPDWATEDTALEIEDILRSLLSVQTSALTEIVKGYRNGGGSGTSSDEVKKANDELDKFFRNLKRTNEEDSKKRKRNQEKEKEDKDRRDRESKKKDSDFAYLKIMGGLVKAGKKVKDVQIEYFKTSNDLYHAGVNLLTGSEQTTSSLLSLNQIVSLTGIRMEDFRKVIEKYSSSINAVGVTKFAKSISLVGGKLTSLGYNYDDQMDLIGSLIESETSFMDIRHRSSAELADDAVRYGRELNGLSLATGQSREQLLQNVKALSTTADSMDVAAEYGQDAANRINLLAGSFKDSNLQGIIQKFASTTSLANEDLFQTFTKAGLGTEVLQLSKVVSNARDGLISMTTAQKQFGDIGKRVTSGQLQALRTLAVSNTPGAKEARDLLAAIRTQAFKTSEATSGQNDAATKAQSSLSKLTNEVERSKSLIENAFPLLETQVDTLSGGLKVLNNVVERSINVFSAQTRSGIGIGLEIVGLVAAFALGKKSLMGGIRGTFSILSDIIKTSGSVLSNAIGGLSKNIGSVSKGIAGFAVRYAAGYAIDAAVGAAGVGKGKVDKKQDEKNWNRMKLWEKAESGLGRTIETIGHIASLDNMANEAAAQRIKAETEYLNKHGAKLPKKQTEISIPKNPASSTINSPSAVPADPTKVNSDIAPEAPEPTSAAVGSGIEKPPRTSDINSLLSYQSTILEQILLGTNNMVSVNKDILKYSKNHA